jgi:universal stress protein E
MRRILVATDLTQGSVEALRRAGNIAGTDSDLRIVHALSSNAPEEAAASARRRLEAMLRETTGLRAESESGVSIRICRGEPADVILNQASRFGADLVILGAHGEPRLRDAIFGTTASHVVREAAHPVLVAQNEAGRAYSRVMVAVDKDAADEVLKLALEFAAPAEVHVVHAFGSAVESLLGDTDLLEDVRTEQDVLIARVRQKLEASGREPARFHTIVEEGDEMDVIMRAWTKVRPDLVVMGTHGRTGVAHLLRGSLAETALLGCPSDMLIMRTAAKEESGS